VTEPPTLTDPSTDMDRSVTTDQAGLTGVQECDEPAPEPVYVDDIIVGDESTAHSGETAGSDPAGSLDSETGSDERDESASHASESPEDESETTMSIDDFDGVAMMAVPAPVVGGSDSVTPDLAAVTVAAENQGSDESEPNPLGHVQLTFTASASATSLMALRARFKAAPTAWGLADVTIGDLVCFAAVRALRQFPAMNAAVRGAETGSGSVVDLGIAVDTGHGLVHPTIRDAGMMGLKQLSRQTKALAEQARSGDISPALLTGSTFAVTNLGAFGIESFTAILHAPQVAILGVNAIQPRAVVHPDGSYGAEQAISFSLTVDHAVVDEADAARYLQSLCAIIADLDLVIMADGGLDH
jgi:pyruvate dehydrogenase E2 component (dihydrolipoamide acetyltransferase)